MVSRGLIERIESIELIELSYLWYILMDYAISIELQRNLYHDMVVLKSYGNDPEKFAILDNITTLYDPSNKPSIEKLIDKFKEEMSKGNSKMLISTRK